LPPTQQTRAEPILKPKKYHGPIPQSSLSIAIGFYSGASAEEMWSYLDRQIDQPLQKELKTEDFGSAPNIDLVYNKKLHPNFAFRLKGGVAFLKSSSTGQLVPSPEVDTLGLAPLLDFNREFNTTLFSFEASALYYFQDASVDEFQMYLGGGFGFYLPWEKYEESYIDHDTGEPYGSREVEDTSVEPGVHAMLGALYHVKNDVALYLEGRVLLTQSKFTIDLPTESNGIQPITFDTDYAGFVLAVGVSKFF
jgi:hypothetical protein